MKTLNELIFLTHTIKHKPLWKRLKEFLTTVGCAFASYWLAVPSHSQSYYQGAVMILRKSFAPVAQAALAIHARTKAVRSTIINNRIYAGLVLVVIVAPLSACIHMLPGMKDNPVSVEVWFYQVWYNLFLVLGPYFFSMCIILAAFLWIQPVNKRIKFSQKPVSFQLTRALSIPFGYCIGKIIWLIFCDNNDDFERLGHWSFFAGGVVIGYVLFRMLDYLVWRQEHAMNALIDTLEGLYKAPNIEHEQRNKIATPYWQELREFHSKY